MADLWTLSTAIVSLRRRLGDSPTDKYVHMMDVDPEPDGRQRVFSVPDSNLVATTLKVFIDGEPDEDVVPDNAQGSFTMEAPDAGEEVRACYNFQWFTDAQLEDFLTNGAAQLGYDTVLDGTLPLGLRPATLSYGAFYAYMFKAAQAADVMTTAEAGFSTDTSKRTPNWLSLAKMMWDTAVRERTSFENPVGSGRAAMVFRSFRLPRYVPRT